MMERKNNTDSEIDLGGFRRKQIIHTIENNDKTF